MLAGCFTDLLLLSAILVNEGEAHLGGGLEMTITISLSRRRASGKRSAAFEPSRPAQDRLSQLGLRVYENVGSCYIENSILLVYDCVQQTASTRAGEKPGGEKPWLRWFKMQESLSYKPGTHFPTGLEPKQTQPNSQNQPTNPTTNRG